MATVAIVAATAAAPPSAFGQDPAAQPRPIVGSSAAKTATGSPKTVTLITGDKVLVAGAGTSSPVVTVLPREDGSVPSVETRRVGKDVYVYPADAADALSAGKVDEELFNVTGLVAMGYDDASTDTVPVIARYTTDLSRARSAPTTPKGAAKGQTLHSIDGIVLKADKDQASDFFADVADPSTAAGAKIEKIWLDGKAHARLDKSAKQVNADKAWAVGLTGTGTKVAVLDTGADAEHPDLQGRIVASQDFTGSRGGALSDVHGHGTHTASTVGGSGAASGGLKRGVAPGASLLIGKVLGDNGGGYDSGIIAGMEWAVAQHADIVSMSLGSSAPPGKCDDPLSSAAQELATTSTTLFVIAAGNTGSANNTVTAPSCAPAVLTVGAVDRQDVPAWFSSRGPAAFTHTLKPEISAPGVDISAARSGGRGDDAYQSMSGTSMATPHVAGAGAIVKQAHPTWTGQQLKAALVSSAKSDVPGDVRAQGAGRLDVIDAVNEVVTTMPVQGGTFAWPHTSAQITTLDVPYSNVSDKPVTLQLSSTAVTGDDGSAVKSAPVTLGASTVTVPAGQTVTVPLKIDPTAKLDAGQYGDVTGRILATGDATVSTPFSLYVTPETVQLTVRMTDRLGKPANSGSSIDVVNIDSFKGQRAFNNGAAEQTFQVRPGTYFLSSFVRTPDPTFLTPNTLGSIAYFGRPELKITGNLTVDFDATKAHLLSVKTDRPSVARASVLAFSRTWDDTWIHSGSLGVGSTATAVYADVQGNPQEGTWEFGDWSRRYAPTVESMSVVGGPVLHPIAADWAVAGLDGVGTAPLVDGGTGLATELTPARVGGKVALVKVSGPGLSLTLLNRAAAAGAKALVFYAPAPGKWIPSSGFSQLPVASYSLPMAEGDQVKSMLASAPGGELALAYKATAKSPYVYNLGFTQSTPLTDDKTFVAQDKTLGRTEASYTGMGVASPMLDYVYAQRDNGFTFGVSGYEAITQPQKRTEFYTDGGTKWLHFLTSSLPFGEAMGEAWRTYPAGSVRTDSWYGGIVAPAAIKNDQGVEQLTAERQGELMGFAPQMWGDDFGHVAYAGSFGDEGNLTLRRNGVVVGTSAYPSGVFTVPAEDSQYELEMNTGKYGTPSKWWARSTEIKTTWGFRSTLDPDTFSVGLPLLFPRVSLPEDGNKTLASSAGQVLPIRVTGHGGYAPGDIVSAKFAYSYDGGTTWTDAATSSTGGAWAATVDHTGASGKTVATRVEVADSKGATVTQVVKAAYSVR
ncbi:MULTISPECIES: S8 family serine peptidase [Kribbella]|uniref:S8 family peptidase n=1 Tax=Kribbella TaxID=182639 RepID=UPI0010526B03|nr:MULTISPECIES: S8 family serine peptidase [Kribbella]